jgi:hypothetical protein
VTNRVRPGFGSNDPLLRAIAEHWDDIERRADPRQRQLFAGLVAGTAELDPDEARAALADELLDILPPDHPVSLILRSGTMYSPAPETPASVTIDVDRRSRRRHAADSQLVLAQDAEVTARLLQNLAPVIGSLQPTKDAVLRVGALLIVKVDWAVSVFQLTAATWPPASWPSITATSPKASCSPSRG